MIHVRMRQAAHSKQDSPSQTEWRIRKGRRSLADVILPPKATRHGITCTWGKTHVQTHVNFSRISCKIKHFCVCDCWTYDNQCNYRAGKILDIPRASSKCVRNVRVCMCPVTAHSNGPLLYYHNRDVTPLVYIPV